MTSENTVTFCFTHLHVHIVQALPVDVDADIEKDVGRTFPNAARYALDIPPVSHQPLESSESIKLEEL